MIDLARFSPLGFGVTGPHASRIANTGHVSRLIREALAAGVTYFDTGPAYGNGRGEIRLGRALEGVDRNQVFISTKAGIHAGRVRDFSPGAVEMSLKASLERLGLEHVDLLLLHGPAPQELTPKLISHLRAFKKRGLFHHLGICGRGAELEEAIRIEEIDTIMAPVNASLSAEELDRLERCKQSGLSVIGIEALKGTAASARLPVSHASAWYLARAIKQTLSGQAPERAGQTPAEALSFALDHKLTDSVISLTTKLAHLHANARLAGLNPPHSQPNS